MGETCGACFNPDINNDCGKCAPNLACQSADPRLPDLPGKCVKEEDLKGNFFSKIINKQLNYHFHITTCHNIQYLINQNWSFTFSLFEKAITR